MSLVPLPRPPQDAPAPRARRLELVARPRRQQGPDSETLGLLLLREGVVAPDDMVQALALHAQVGGRLADILLSRGLISEARLGQTLARHWGLAHADLDAIAPDPRLIDRLGAVECLRAGLLPWRMAGGLTLIATPFPEDFERERPRLTALFGPVAMALTSAPRLEEALLALRGRHLDQRAISRVPDSESCRGWGQASHLAAVRAVAALLLAWAVLAPASLVWLLSFWAAFTLLLATAMRTAAIFAALHRRSPDPPLRDSDILPTVSVMVALYNEGDIAARLVRRLSRLDYPRERLDCLLVVEEDDQVTRRALRRAALPNWMRIVVVPDGSIRTKPRALNHALNLCRGSIIGIYDAEDAPEPDQIRKIAARFLRCGPEVACLQGVLDFYNPRTNWLSRCFTMEYATWFRVLLPGLARLGLPVPLGGTTLFFRRNVLEELGAWDAHNVTEDADLGMRLARHGYRTELVNTTTFEEANCRALPWIKQRSRWLKGYMMTYGVHMRRPALLLRQLGWWQFAGFQVLFLTSISQYVLTPVLWSFWLVPLGLPHPVAETLPPGLYAGLTGLFLFTEGLLIAITIAAMRLTPNRLSPLWSVMLHFYFPLGALASYKAAWELVRKPFWWDKTSHGHFDPSEDG
ncbi:glycosyltransferase [Gemmobacter caeruleus]|uniref:glycosyltransferase n=1 Tax=Gemmobacter caeruleus TaxID=2595004 RepID=UPI0011EFBDA6|nr:glycosyltransferase [Gemmobacter caeruleus]